MSKAIVFSWGLFALFGLSLGLVACSNTLSDNPTINPVAVNSSQSSLSQPATDNLTQPLGSYITTLKAKDFHPEIYEEFPTLRHYIGRWELQFTDQGRFSIKVNNQLEVEGNYSLSNDELFLTSSKWPSLCKTYEAPATISYRWRMQSNNKALTLLGKTSSCDVTGMTLLARELLPTGIPPITQ